MRETSQAINLLLFFPSLCWKNGYFLQFFPQSSRPRLAPSSNRLHCCASVHFIWLQSGRRRPISDTAELRSYLPRRRHCQHDRITQVSRLNQQKSCDSFFPDRRLDRLSVLSLSRRSARSTKNNIPGCRSYDNWSDSPGSGLSLGSVRCRPYYTWNRNW